MSSPETIELVDEVVEAWSRRWFPDHRLRRRQVVFANPSATEPVVASTARLSVRAGSAVLEALVGRALDLDLSRLEIGDGDRLVIDALADELMKDLADTLDTAMAAEASVSSASDRSGGVLIEIADDDGRKILTIATSRSVLAGARRPHLPADRAARGVVLTPLRSALADVPMTLMATVGSATVSLSEARRLAPGDVIVLDRPLDEPIDLSARPDGPRIACARLVDAASPRSLRLEAVARGDSR